MKTEDYFDEVENQRLIVACEIAKAAARAKRDHQNDTHNFLNPEVETCPFIGESVAMEQEYNRVRNLILIKYSRS